MLNEQQFGKFKPNKPKGPAKPKKPKAPGLVSKGGSGGYKFLPVPKSQEERDLLEAKARELNYKLSLHLQEGRKGQRQG
jgi:hypothetical protein